MFGNPGVGRGGDVRQACSDNRNAAAAPLQSRRCIHDATTPTPKGDDGATPQHQVIHRSNGVRTRAEFNAGAHNRDGRILWGNFHGDGARMGGHGQLAEERLRLQD